MSKNILPIFTAAVFLFGVGITGIVMSLQSKDMPIKTQNTTSVSRVNTPQINSSESTEKIPTPEPTQEMGKIDISDIIKELAGESQYLLSPNKDKLAVLNQSNGNICSSTMSFDIFNLSSKDKIYPKAAKKYSKSFSLNQDKFTKWIDNDTLEYTSNHITQGQCELGNLTLSTEPQTIKI